MSWLRARVPAPILESKRAMARRSPFMACRSRSRSQLPHAEDSQCQSLPVQRQHRPSQRLLDEIGIRRWVCGSEHAPAARFVQRRAVFERNDATAKDDDVVKSCFWVLTYLRNRYAHPTGRRGRGNGRLRSNGVHDLLMSSKPGAITSCRRLAGRATTFAPRSWPSRPGLATTMRKGWSMNLEGGPPIKPSLEYMPYVVGKPVQSSISVITSTLVAAIDTGCHRGSFMRYGEMTMTIGESCTAFLFSIDGNSSAKRVSTELKQCKDAATPVIRR